MVESRLLQHVETLTVFTNAFHKPFENLAFPTAPKVISLKLTGTYFGVDAYFLLLHQFPNLQDLHVNGLYETSAVGNHLDPQCDLRTVAFTDCLVEDKEIEHLLKNQVNITSLSFERCSVITRQLLVHLVSTYTLLTALRLVDLEELDDDGVLSVFRATEGRLLEVYLQPLTYAINRRLDVLGSNLTSLSLICGAGKKFTPQAGSQMLRYMVTDNCYESFQAFAQLQSLHIHGTVIYSMEAYNLQLARVLPYCRRLRSVTISMNSINSALVAAMAGYRQHLESLTFVRCVDRLEVGEWKAFLNACPLLRSFAMVSDATTWHTSFLKELRHGFTRLERLEFTGDHMVTWSVLSDVVAHCTNLTEITVRGNANLPEGLTAHLQSLNSKLVLKTISALCPTFGTEEK